MLTALHRNVAGGFGGLVGLMADGEEGRKGRLWCCVIAVDVDVAEAGIADGLG